MNQQDSINLVERYYAAFNGGDMDTFLNLLTDDVIHDINQGKREIGKEAFTQFMACMNYNYKEQLVDMVIMATEMANAQPLNLWYWANILKRMKVCLPQKDKHTVYPQALFLKSVTTKLPASPIIIICKTGLLRLAINL